MNEMHALPRLAAPALKRALRTFPVVVVTGARQTGKTTLVRGLAGEEGREYHTLDDIEVLRAARDAPDSLVGGRRRLVLDEIQRSPDLLLAVKRAVDERRAPGRFLLTGSANLLLMRKVSESLAGRAVYLNLGPMTRGELDGRGACGAWDRILETEPGEWPALFPADGAGPADWKACVLRGGFPAAALQIPDDRARADWFEGYARTYMERDLLDVGSVASLVDFRRLLQVLFLRLGGPADQSGMASDVGISQPTVHRHLNLLETSFLLVRVPAYGVNRTRRLLKTPRIYACDTGLALHLSGETEPRGAHLENLVLADLLAWKAVSDHRPEILYWRTVAGHEVDFVIEAGRRLLPLEIKATARPRIDDARGLEAFLDDYADKAKGGLVLHGGGEVRWLTSRVLAVPWWRVM